MHICGIQKISIDDFICKVHQRHRCRKQTYGYHGGNGGEELEDWDWHIYTIDTMYKIDN